MTRIYSYVLRYDDGAAPNPFWGICTLAICKPAIRRTARVGDWVIGTGSKHSRCNDGTLQDFSDSLVYAMRVSDIKSLAGYDAFCKTELPDKIPNKQASDWTARMGDCIYDYGQEPFPAIRAGVHNEGNRDRDLRGKNVLLSDLFYYFGEEPRILPFELRGLIKQNQGHRKIENPYLVSHFEEWISQYERNKLYADPQLRSHFDQEISCSTYSVCAQQHFEEDEVETEEVIC